MSAPQPLTGDELNVLRRAGSYVPDIQALAASHVMEKVDGPEEDIDGRPLRGDFALLGRPLLGDFALLGRLAPLECRGKAPPYRRSNERDAADLQLHHHAAFDVRNADARRHGEVVVVLDVHLLHVGHMAAHTRGIGEEGVYVGGRARGLELSFEMHCP